MAVRCRAVDDRPSLDPPPRVDPAVDARRCRLPPYNGAAELLWDSIEDLVEASSSREGREAGKELLEDERRFIDLPNSSLFYVREHEIVAS